MSDESVDWDRVYASQDEVRALRAQLDGVERRKSGLVRLQGRLSEFHAGQCSQVGSLRTGFPAVRCVGRLANALSETLSGPGFYAADARLSALTRAADADIDAIQDRIDVVQRRIRLLLADG